MGGWLGWTMDGWMNVCGGWISSGVLVVCVLYV